ncbi:DUF167 domain-containing protein [Polymorphobacter fuscus]|uniref:UPF0235 protein F3168_12625 n=1 Tax=Sandarakinorhabdus fusca TaxID=1439888 RepID=A0A7C9KJ67_9SPHN|nr:DUF167 domain-containing protein [Polymorphobacter fuscus]MQT18100.1 DUF167 domain-containing protein [Polymorphobacter fuscus]
MPHAWTPVAGGLSIAVRVTPRGGRDAIEGLGHDADTRPHLKLRVAAAPVDGDANDAVEKLVAKWLGVPRSHVEVTAGLTLRLKRVLVDGDPVQLARRAQAKLLETTA